MRTCHLTLVSLLLLELLMCFHAEAFVKISVPTAFAIITAAVKSKAVLLKAYLGLRSLGYIRSRRRPLPYGMGYSGEYYYGHQHHPRYKRSVTPSSSSAAGVDHKKKKTKTKGAAQPVFNPDDLMAAWRELESAARRPLIFDESSCAKASKSDRKQLPLWSKLLQSEFVNRLSNREYSILVSSLVGSMTGDPRACQFTKIITANLIQSAQPAQVVTVDLPVVTQVATTSSTVSVNSQPSTTVLTR